MVVDEYQQLLEGDSDRGSQLLSKVLEKGRAAGIHLLLGSQTFEVRGLAVSAIGWGVSIVGASLMPNLPWTFVMLLFVGYGSIAFNSLAKTTLQLKTVPAMRK